MENNNSEIEDKVEETKTKKTFKEILKKNKFIILIMLLIIIVAITLLIINLNKEETIEEVELSTINLINSELTLEYGEEYEFNLEDFVDDEDLSKYEVTGELEYKEIETETTDEEETDAVDFTEEQEETIIQYESYPEVGEYTFIISAENYKETEVMVIVEDTTTPELNVPTNIQIVLGTNLDEYDFKQYFESSDLSKLNEYNVDYNNVDVNIVGDYVISVSISDIYENIVSKDITISIVEIDGEYETVVNTSEDGTRSVVIEKQETAETESTNTTTSTSTNSSSSGSNTTSGSTGTTSNSSSSSSTATTSTASTTASSSDSTTSSTESSSTTPAHTPFSTYSVERTDIENAIISAGNAHLSEVIESYKDINETLYNNMISSGYSWQRGTQSEAYSKATPGTYRGAEWTVSGHDNVCNYYVYAEDIYMWDSTGTTATLFDTEYYLYTGV